jgi:CDP-diacylglycerol---glycerol-3-phosphate 3-phosphatidyltransferase
VPVVVVALTGGSAIAAIVFAIAALTDGLDGYIARSRQSVTTFGKVMDPVADKLMIAAALSRSSASTAWPRGWRW